MSGPTPIFLFSLPRAGSTLLQRILASHPEVATSAEPHILLPIFASLDESGVYSEYEHQMTTFAIQEFCEHALPNGSDDYRSAIRAFAEHLYAQAASDHERFFLDKTPRYHIISQSIIDAFPDARFVVLWRNPLAVAASMNSTFWESRWMTYLWYFDLYRGLDALIETSRANADKVITLRYEDLVSEPTTSLQRLSDYLGLEYDQSSLESFGSVGFDGQYRDPNADLPDYQQVTTRPLDRWTEFYDNPLRKRWARRYLDVIGVERLAVMGYDRDELLADLDAIPNTRRHLFHDMARMPYGSVSRGFESHLVRDKLRRVRDRERVYMLK